MTLTEWSMILTEWSCPPSPPSLPFREHAPVCVCQYMRARVCLCVTVCCCWCVRVGDVYFCVCVNLKDTDHYDFIIHSCLCNCLIPLVSSSRSGELRTQKLKSHLVRTQSLNVLPFKPGVGQYTAIHATLTARDFFLAYFYPSSPFTCIFSKTSPNFFLCWPAE